MFPYRTDYHQPSMWSGAHMANRPLDWLTPKTQILWHLEQEAHGYRGTGQCSPSIAIATNCHPRVPMKKSSQILKVVQGPPDQGHHGISASFFHTLPPKWNPEPLDQIFGKHLTNFIFYEAVYSFQWTFTCALTTPRDQ